MAQVAYLILWFVFGAILGSFANVYFYRLPLGRSLLFPRSFCPQCECRILWKENIPIFSYFLLRGKCSSCFLPISFRYPLVEFFCALLFLSQGFFLSALPFFSQFILGFYGFLLFLMAGIDLVTYFQFDKKYGIIPDHLHILAVILGLIFVPFNPFLPEVYWKTFLSVLSVVAGLLAMRWIFTRVFRRESLGLADVKMLSVIALFLSWRGAVISFFLACLLGAILAIILISFKKIPRQSSIPFGAFLALGTLIYLWVNLLT